jgi:Uma2 family endonuclease
MLEPMVEPSEVKPDVIRPLRRVEYDRLVEAGVFEDEKVELLAGQLVTMSPQGETHAGLVARLTAILVKQIPDTYEVRPQLPIALSDLSEPEPDLAVVARDAFGVRPSSAALVVEIGRTSLHKDRGIKAQLYAAAGIREYWVVDADDLVIEIHRDCAPSGYRSIERLDRHAKASPLAFPHIVICLADVVT